MNPERYALTIKVNECFLILYSKIIPPEEHRFTIMHEIGHIILGHLDNNELYNHIENEANIFASMVLMPMIVIHTEQLFSTKQISDFFGVSTETAELRLKRYKKIKERKKFLCSPLERKYFGLYITQE